MVNIGLLLPAHVLCGQLTYRRGLLNFLYMFRRLDAARTYALPCSNGKAPPAAPLGRGGIGGRVRVLDGDARGSFAA